MKKTLTIGTVLSALAMSASGSFAQTAQQDLTVQATVASFCKLGGITATVGGSATGSNTVLPTDITVVDGLPTAIASTGAAGSWNFAVLCNSAATFEMIANPLITSASAPSGFSNKIGYTATGSGAGVLAANYVATATGSASTVGTVSANNANGTLNVAITAPTVHGGTSSTSPLVAGSYSGVVNVMITPQ